MVPNCHHILVGDGIHEERVMLDVITKQMLEDAIHMFNQILQIYDDSPSANALVIMEILNFLMYLSAADGKISPQEAMIISGVMGNEGIDSEEHIQNWIIDHDLHSRTFENKLPLSFQLAIDFDNKVYQAGM